MKAIILIGVMLIGLGSVALANKRLENRQKPIGKQISARYAQLNLSPTQAQAIKAIRAEFRTKKAELIGKREKKKQLMRLKLQTYQQINTILTPDQRQLRKRLRDERLKRHPKKGLPHVPRSYTRP